MTTNMQIEQLKKEANSNPVAKDVFTMFASRKRARQNVQVDALERRMIKEGFSHPKEAYRSVLKFLVGVGFGKLDLGPGGKVRGIKELRTTLQSIGSAAYGEVAKVRNFKKRARFGDLARGTTIGVPVQTYGEAVAKAVAAIEAPPPVTEKVAATPAQATSDKREGPADRRRAPRPYQVENAKVVLTFLLDSGKPVSIPLPPDMSTEDTANLIDRLQSGDAGNRKEIGHS